MKRLLERNRKRAIRLICEVLCKENIPWVLGGSTALLLRGVRLQSQPRDIDIFTNREGANKINKLFGRYEVAKVMYRENHKYASYFGFFSIYGIRVEVIADLTIRGNGTLYYLHIDQSVISKAKGVIVNGYAVKLLPLEEQLVSNMVKGNYDRVFQILEYLKTCNVHWEYIKDIVKRGKYPSNFIKRIRGMNKSMRMNFF